MKFGEWLKWFLQTYLTTEHFTNAIAFVIISVAVVKELMSVPITSEYHLLLGIVVGYYFKPTSKIDKLN